MTNGRWPAPVYILNAIENALLDEMKDQPLAVSIAARRAVAKGLQDAIAAHQERRNAGTSKATG